MNWNLLNWNLLSVALLGLSLIACEGKKEEKKVEDAPATSPLKVEETKPTPETKETVKETTREETKEEKKPS